MSAFLYMELCTVAAYGWGWVRAWNILDMVRVKAAYDRVGPSGTLTHP